VSFLGSCLCFRQQPIFIDSAADMIPSLGQTEEDKTVRLLTQATFGRWLDDDSESPSEVIKGLYLGSVNDARDVTKLRSLGVTHVLNAASNLYDPNAVFFSRGLLVQYLSFPAQDIDEYPIQQHFAAGVDFIHEAIEGGGTILVHCAAGVSRSTTLVCAYLMRARQLPCFEAVMFVNRQRACASPNPGFLRALLRFQEAAKQPLSPRKPAA
jgi:protein-tyrosine phosphatase